MPAKGSSKTAGKTASKTTNSKEPNDQPQVCDQPEAPVRQFDPGLDQLRMELIRNGEKKWVNGTVLHYAFLDQPATWRGADEQKQAVENAFSEWKALGIGLEFQQVHDPRDAEIRIGFQRGGSWSYVGRDAVDHVPDPAERTMNFGWDLTTDYGHDTALHEIGHAMGFPHEHQNPNAGIVWDEAAVIDRFLGSPNFWDEAKTRHNILNKLNPGEHSGSSWDRNSIMHYQFGSGLILEPNEFRNAPLIPAPGLSQVDIDTAREFYPALKQEIPQLRPFEAHRLQIDPGSQVNFFIEPSHSRTYTMQTFGEVDTVMVLFEDINGDPRYYDGDDDSGTNLNARIKVRLFRGRRYLLRLRLYHVQSAGEAALMMW